MSKEKNFFSAVVYVHNAEQEIAGYLKNLITLLETHFEHSEIVCVNDFSTDDSVAQIKSVSNEASSTALSILNMSYYHGLEIAMNAGVDIAIGDFVLEADNAVQDYSMELIMTAYREVLKGSDIVSVSPDKKQRLSSSLFYWMYGKFSESGHKMRTETFRILSRRAINRISSMSRTIPYRKGLYANCGLEIANLLYKPIKTQGAIKEDQQTKHYRSSLAVETLVLFTNTGYFFSKLMTSIMMAISLFMICYTVAIYALAKPITGWTTTILFLAVAFLGLFGILTIIIKYLQILIDLNFKRAKYSFKSIEKLTK